MGFRTGVAAIGFLVAFTAGWRLSPPITALVVVYTWLPLVTWCLFAPPGRVAGAVEVSMVAGIATVFHTIRPGPGYRTVGVVRVDMEPYLLAGSVLMLACVAWLLLRRRVPGIPPAGDRRRRAELRRAQSTCA